MNELLPVINSDKFTTIYERLILSEALDESDLSYILACAMLFLSEYSRDRRKKRLFDLGYYICLKYAIDYQDYEPLYDVSVNFGMFPISSYISDLDLLNSINQFYIINRTQKYYRNGIYETVEQRESRDTLLASDSLDRVFVAPTSYGKSAFILDIIEKYVDCRIAIIVPTKSLLSQTYSSISEKVVDRKIIFHDEMYSGEKSFIGVLTQERALRLLSDSDVTFDVIVIDEAHKIFDADARSILLTRLLRKNRKRLPRSKIFYLSPLISNPDNVRFSEMQVVDSYVISRSMKEPEIFEYKLNGYAYRYDKYCNRYHELKKYESYKSYILNNLREKNFFYHKRPVKVQDFAAELYHEVSKIKTSEVLDGISKTISDNVHSDFYGVEYVKKGIVYLHGKLPDILKEYLEFKFRTIPELKYVVANSVVLEGINFPVDNLFVMNTYGIKSKDLVNLIGRVNRLNMVFSEEGHSLSKLMPPIHFVNTVIYEKEKSKMENKIEKLRAKEFSDEVLNPTLVASSGSYSVSETVDGEGAGEAPVDRNALVRETEDFIVDHDDIPESQLKILFIETGLSSLYSNSEYAFEVISNRLDDVTLNGGVEEIIDVIYSVFVEGLEGFIIDPVFLRFKHDRARDFYKMFIAKCHRYNLRELIDDFVKYFKSIRQDDRRKLFFIGDAFGEESKIKEDGGISRKSYINLARKSDRELANLALVKIKMETDFVSYRVNEYAKFLFKGNVISKSVYERFVYGSENRIGSKLAQLGLGGAAINKIDRDGMLPHVKIDDLGRIEVSTDFKEYLARQDDLFIFEFRKYIKVLD